ncbi:hypothetical protein EDB81DRAFT_895468 [Dactylonectria macrodidyma]|uniref:VWFA domain-containing protein n=1 Tax=Dactylonectria macrodidyma TaxID=307937 RepID=A0A9P9I741_9HYPO|nr:hypothetical protein EDB81DRAFT_895468 [Dactylonectria macrodidyma]
MFERIKEKFTLKNSSSSEAKERLSRRDVTAVNGAGVAWNTNPFLESSSATKPSNETPETDLKTPGPLLDLQTINLRAQVDPPAYTASAGPSAITSAEDEYAFLSTFDTVFIIDDSGSMAGQSWCEVCDALLAITPICTSHDLDGIDVYFLNHKSGAPGPATQAPNGYNNIRSPADVRRLFESVRPSGATPTGNRLQSILNPYITNISRHPDRIGSTKPVNIIVITDGVPTDDPESIIVHHARRLDQLNAPPHQELDDDLADLDIRDMVDTVTWTSNSKSLSADGILKVVLGAVVRRIDRKAIGRSDSRSRK